MLFVLLAGCLPTASGSVVSAEGPVSGAVLRAVSGPALDAVSDASGRFTVRVEPGTRTVRITHPDYLPAEVEWAVDGRGEVALSPVSVVGIPVAPGPHLLMGDHFETLPRASVVRRGTVAQGFQWCVDRAGSAALSVPAGTLRVLDNHAADWRIFTLDAEGCGYSLKPTPGGFYDQQSQRVEVRRVEAHGPGRDWLQVDLPAGEYLVADWYESGFVPDGDGWRGSWVKAE